MASQFSDTCIYSGIKWPLHECFETCPRSAEDVDVGCLINDAIDLFVDRQFVVSIRGVLHEDLGASTLRLIATDDFLHLSTRVFHRRRTKETIQLQIRSGTRHGVHGCIPFVRTHAVITAGLMPLSFSRALLMRSFA